MNKKELLLEAKRMIPKGTLFSGFFIIPQRELHESGYKIMYIIGHTRDYNKYYLGLCSDVLNLYGGVFEGFKDIKTINLDINKNGIIHIWSDYDLFKPRHINISSVWLDNVGDNNE